MCEELKISIEELKIRKSEMQIFISRPFEYGRFPSDDSEFKSIATASDGLKIINATLIFAEELLESIESNAKQALSTPISQQYIKEQRAKDAAIEAMVRIRDSRLESTPHLDKFDITDIAHVALNNLKEIEKGE